MIDPKQKQREERKSGFNPVTVGVTAAIVGAGIAVAGAVVLKDKKNREKVKQVLTNVKDQAVGYVEDIQKQAEDKKEQIKEKLVEGEEKVEKLVSATKD